MTDLEAAQDALARKKLRVSWEGPRPETLTDARLLAALWGELRRQWPTPPGNSQDESVQLRVAAPSPLTLAWVATYDFDYASSSDRTETRQGMLRLPG